MESWILRTHADLLGVREAWAAARPATPFATWEFAHAWLRAPTVAAEPFVIAVSERDHPVMLAPWCVAIEGGRRRLTGIGGEFAWYHDPLVLRPEGEKAATRAILAALASTGAEWETLCLNLRLDSSAHLIAGLPRLGWGFGRAVPDFQHPSLSLGEDWGGYWASRPADFRGSVRRRLRKLAERPHRFLRAQGEQLDVVLEQLLRLHALRWGYERDWRPYHDFIRRLAREVPDGSLWVTALEIGGRVVAGQLVLISGDRAHDLVGAYDRSESGLAVGTLLTIWTLERMHGEGIRHVDLGPGQVDWKGRLLTHHGATRQVHAGAGLSGGLRLALAELRPWLGTRYPGLVTAYRRLVRPLLGEEASCPL